MNKTGEKKALVSHTHTFEIENVPTSTSHMIPVSEKTVKIHVSDMKSKKGDTGKLGMAIDYNAYECGVVYFCFRSTFTFAGVGKRSFMQMSLSFMAHSVSPSPLLSIQ